MWRLVLFLIKRSWRKSASPAPTGPYRWSVDPGLEYETWARRVMGWISWRASCLSRGTIRWMRCPIRRPMSIGASAGVLALCCMDHDGSHPTEASDRASPSIPSRPPFPPQSPKSHVFVCMVESSRRTCPVNPPAACSYWIEFVIIE
jgi:hypothetical protein